jgi:hypothetical protein
MSITEQIEEKFGLKIESLNALERETYNKMLEAVQKAQIDHLKLREYIISMRDAIERELINEPEFIRIFLWKVENRKQILLKARLQNYMLLESFLISPERAKQQLEDMVAGMASK